VLLIAISHAPCPFEIVTKTVPVVRATPGRRSKTSLETSTSSPS
jgi:hypothetical protein